MKTKLLGLCAKSKLVSAALVPAITFATLLSIVDARATTFQVDGTTAPMFVTTAGGAIRVGSITLSGTFDLGAILASPFRGPADLTLALPPPPPSSDWGSGVIFGAAIGDGSTVGSWSLIGSNGIEEQMSLIFSGDLVNFAGGPFSGTWSELLETCIGNNCDETTVTFSVSGTATALTPIPTALPLFATGIGCLGLLGWRRKRKNTAAIAAC